MQLNWKRFRPAQRTIALATLIAMSGLADHSLCEPIHANVVSNPGPVGSTSAARLIASAELGRVDVPRIELAARMRTAGLEDSNEYRIMRDDTARELAGRPDGVGAVSKEQLHAADDAIAWQVAVLEGTAQPPRTLAELAKLSGRPQIPGLRIVYLNPLGRPAEANKWNNILAHQTEGPAGSARAGAVAQAANPTRRGVTIWVETDGVVYWATAENAIPTHGDGANRNDNRFIDNAMTYHAVTKADTIGVEFAGNYPDVTRPPTSEQIQAWSILVRFLQERYKIPASRIYAHQWIDFKDARYCEGCELATFARSLAYVPESD